MTDTNKGFDMCSIEDSYAAWKCLDDGGNLRVGVVPSRSYRCGEAVTIFVLGNIFASLPMISTSGSLSPISWIPILSKKSFESVWSIGMFLGSIFISLFIYAVRRHTEEGLIKHGPVLEHTSKAIIIHSSRGEVAELPLDGRVVITKREFKGSEHWYDRWTYAYQSTSKEMTIAVMGGGEKCAFHKAVEKFCKLAAIPIESVDLGRQPEATKR